MAAALGRASAVMLRLLLPSPAAELPKILKRGTMRDATPPPLELFFLMATADWGRGVQLDIRFMLRL